MQINMTVMYFCMTEFQDAVERLAATRFIIPECVLSSPDAVCHPGLFCQPEMRFVLLSAVKDLAVDARRASPCTGFFVAALRMTKSVIWHSPCY
jgi:hypothetical protein